MFLRDAIQRLLLACIPVTVLLIACAPSAPAPTAAPAKPAESAPTAKPATQPTAAPAAQPAAKPAAKPTEAPAAKVEAKPTAAKPAPTEAGVKVAASPKPKATFDEKAVADFYRGKTLRIIDSFAAGGTTDTLARLLQKTMPQYLPGNPNIVVENRPGAGGMLNTNLVFASEPKDGTVLTATIQGLVLQQLIGAQGVQFDAVKFNWLGSFRKAPYTCMARSDTGINTVRDIMDGKELIVGTLGPGSGLHDAPALLNATLGTRFKLVQGYDSAPRVLLAIDAKEVDGVCLTVDSPTSAPYLVSPNPKLKTIVVMGDQTPNRPYLQGVPAAETLAKTEEARLMLRTVNAPERIAFPFAAPPDVPADRVTALRRAIDRAVADPQFVAGAQQARVILDPSTGEEVTQVVQELLSTSPAIVAKLKEILK